jgi:hypothetical protein
MQSSPALQITGSDLIPCKLRIRQHHLSMSDVYALNMY